MDLRRPLQNHIFIEVIFYLKFKALVCPMARNNFFGRRTTHFRVDVKRENVGKRKRVCNMVSNRAAVHGSKFIW